MPRRERTTKLGGGIGSVLDGGMEMGGDWGDGRLLTRSLEGWALIPASLYRLSVLDDDFCTFPVELKE